MASEVVVIDRNARLPTRRRTATEPVDARLLRTIATILPADHPPISALDGETQLEARADATKLAIAADLDCWRYWCAKHQRDPFPADPEHIVLYLRQLEKDGRKPATLARRIASLAAVHQIVGIKTDQLPTNAAMVRNALKGMRRRKGVVQKQAAPLRFGGALATVKGFTVSALLGACVGDVQGLRDAALLSVGFDGGLRVSELVAVSAADLEPDADGSGILALRSSKTDQDGKGSFVWLSPDTMRRVHAWLDASGIEQGPLFRRIAIDRKRAREAVAPVPYDQIAGNTRNWRSRLEGTPASVAEVSFKLGSEALTRQGVNGIYRRVAEAAFDAGLVQIPVTKVLAALSAISTHSLRVGLT